MQTTNTSFAHKNHVDNTSRTAFACAHHNATTQQHNSTTTQQHNNTTAQQHNNTTTQQISHAFKQLEC
jgi:hypothetical protein